MYHVDYFKELIQQNVIMVLLCIFDERAQWIHSIDLHKEFKVMISSKIRKAFLYQSSS